MAAEINHKSLHTHGGSCVAVAVMSQGETHEYKTAQLMCVL